MPAANIGGVAYPQISLAHSPDRLTRFFPPGAGICGVAFDYEAPRGLTVHIPASASGSEVLLNTEDDGPAIPDTDRQEALRSRGRLDVSFRVRDLDWLSLKPRPWGWINICALPCVGQSKMSGNGAKYTVRQNWHSMMNRPAL